MQRNTCSQQIRETDQAIGCDNCIRWYHIACVKLSSDLYELIISIDEDDGIRWLCPSCRVVDNNAGEAAQKDSTSHNFNPALTITSLQQQFNKSLVRPLLEYCCVLWSPTKSGEISLIEGIQRIATFKITSISHLN